ncbi:MAG TPA: M23 family metallopeptidase [Candidatus Hydrogenedens sp.]|nr:M23 family metallopeptidase [Candidatus Hydrogenedens sp.]HOK10222.1 M23 family metallopeptidase [Candidatus Hydrogenedens sp.]HOL20019.1 M23 family metallopeptidase [Candidatus Hydrogenedens sp.]HPP59770.1 M23 family metallopeptidase [Candidatus Hydrogenedens sp.]
MKKKSIHVYFVILVLSLFLFSCARHRHIAPLQVPIREEVSKGAWGFPLASSSFVVTSPFGESRRHRGRHYKHQGIDIKAEKNTPVLATQKGQVIFAGKSGDYGLLVCIKHDMNWESRYAHLRKINVKRGQSVKKGQVIGKVGKSGNATGYHLHFELRRNNVPVNPQPYLSSRK